MPDDLRTLRDLEAAAEAAVVQAVANRDRIRAARTRQERLETNDEAQRRRRRFRIIVVPTAIGASASALRAAAESTATKTAAGVSSGAAVVAVVAAIGVSQLGGGESDQRQDGTYAARPPRPVATAPSHQLPRHVGPPRHRARPGAAPTERGGQDALGAAPVVAPVVAVGRTRGGATPPVHVKLPPVHVTPPVRVPQVAPPRPVTPPRPPVRVDLPAVRVDLSIGRRPALRVSLGCLRQHRDAA